MDSMVIIFVKFLLVFQFADFVQVAGLKCPVNLHSTIANATVASRRGYHHNKKREQLPYYHSVLCTKGNQVDIGCI